MSKPALHPDPYAKIAEALGWERIVKDDHRFPFVEMMSGKGLRRLVLGRFGKEMEDFATPGWRPSLFWEVFGKAEYYTSFGRPAGIIGSSADPPVRQYMPPGAGAHRQPVWTGPDLSRCAGSVHMADRGRVRRLLLLFRGGFERRQQMAGAGGHGQGLEQALASP